MKPSDTSISILPAAVDLVCLSHLRWDFVFQRPQQLMTRYAQTRRVFFVEEPIVEDTAGSDWLHVRQIDRNLHVAVPHIGTDAARAEAAQRALLDRLIAEYAINRYALWYWTPMALPFTRHLTPAATVYDCMDELSAFAGAPASLLMLEDELLRRADVVFTGGQSLFEAKAARHPNIHPFPSSVDVPHFMAARDGRPDPEDQSALPHPRLGYFGVIDERMDLALVEGVARRRPNWHWVLIGPTAKIDPASVPCAPNIHQLGMKPYDQLPDYLAGWDVAVLPFARNDATRFISPTKTPEYLAAGCAVVSTSIRDVVRPYGDAGLVHIADTVDAFVGAVERALVEDRAERLRRVDRLLAHASWDTVVQRTSDLIAVATQRGTVGPRLPHLTPASESHARLAPGGTA